MIDPKELKIGNWVLVEIAKSLGEVEIKYRTEQVDSVFVDGINMEWNHELSDYTHVDKVKPIPLTSEILKKCGFVIRIKDKEIYELSLCNLEKIVIGKLRHHEKFQLFELQYEDNEERRCIYSLLPIYSLHQLQNIYFELTRKELNYSPDK